MIDIIGFPGDTNFPNLPEQVTSANQTVDLSEITSALSDAKDVMENVSADIGVACAECLADMIGVRDNCLACIKGQADEDLATYQALFDKLRGKIVKPIEEALSEVISTGAQLGIPITDMMVMTAPPSAFPPQFDATVNFNASLPPVVTTATTSVVATTPTQSPLQSGLKPGIEAPPQTTLGGTPIPGTGVVTQLPAPTPTPISLTGFHMSICVNGQIVDAASYLQQIGATGLYEPNSGLQGSIDSFGFVDDFAAFQFDQSTKLLRVFRSGNPCTPVTQPSPGNVEPPTQPPAEPVPTFDAVPAIGVGLCRTTDVDSIVGQIESYTLPAKFAAAFGLGVGLVGSIKGFLSSITTLSDPKSTAGADPKFLENGITGLATLLATSVTYRIAKESIQGVLGTECSSNQVIESQTALGFFRAVSIIPGMVPDYVKQTATYQANYLCPFLIPTAADADGLYNRGWIDENQWKFLVRANAVCPEWEKLLRDASQQWITPDQAAIALRRGIIDDEKYQELIKRIGIRDADVDTINYKLTEFIPGPSDIVRFMLRDVFDQSVIDDQELDKEFDEKFVGQAEKWASDQGMTKDVFLKYWESHWIYPSNTQLYEMLFRIPEDTTLPDGKTVAKAVNLDEILKVLGINDVSPKWRARLAAIAYRPTTRVDLRRQFELGLISADEIEKGYRELGYSPENAERQRKFAEVDSLPKQAKLKGNAGASEVLKWYRSSFINRETAETFLKQAGIQDSYIQRYLDTEDNRRIADNKRLGMAALKKRFMSGEFTLSDMSTQLIDIGIDPQQVPDVITNWVRLRDAKYKAPTVGMLCDWFRKGFIEMSEYQTRVSNLGYSHLDAQRIVQTCLGKRNEEIEKQAEKAAKEAQKLEDKRKREAKAAQKELERRLKDAAPCKVVKPKCPTPGQPEKNGQPSPAGG